MMRINRSIALFAVALATGIATTHTVTAGGPAASSSGSAATVMGTVRLEGAAPKLKPISMAADPSCARQHPSPVLTDEVVTDAKGDIQNVLVYIADGLGDREFTPPAEPAVFDQRGCLYQPHLVAVQANQPLQVVNDDPTLHNIHPLPVNNREWNRAELPGAKVEERFAREEVAIPVKCNVHPWMHGYIAVFKHPYFAVTGKDGSFDLRNLPPGTYTIKAWHERLGMATQTITVGANETKQINFTFKAI